MRDRKGVAACYVENEPGPRTAAGLLTRDEARHIAANIEGTDTDYRADEIIRNVG